MFDLTHKPNVLYLASIERIVAARRMIDQPPYDYVIASYLAGLAVESILQAIALHGGGAHDAKHTLSKWLAKCPAAVHDALKGSAEWNLLVAFGTTASVTSRLTRCSGISGTKDTYAGRRAG